MSFNYNFIILFLILCYLRRSIIATVHSYEQYQFQLPVEAQHLCPSEDYLCANGKNHFLCQTHKLCPNYEYIHLTPEWKRIFIAGHNGIRNKVAEDWGIANMNLVHWSRDLETMAMFYLQTCQIANDRCLVIGEQALPVKQNYCLRRRLSKRWPGRVVRSWYLEIGYKVHSVAEYLQQHRLEPIANFTQMIWPSVEFVGCGAAYIQCSFYLIVCYYHPPYVEQNLSQAFHLGTPCTKCQKSRNVCSLDFLGLCGIATVHSYEQYQFQLPVEAQHLCPSEDYLCANGKNHFLCQTHKLCPNYEYIHLTPEWKRIFIAGHNGIRNKVAEDWGIANMNLVHWSRDLETMAMFYLQTCQIANDHCLVIGEQALPVKQNYCLRRRLSKRWPGRVVRSWYLEIGYKVHSVAEYLQQHRLEPIANFTQMIWPSVEFVGCGAAYIQCSFYLIVCYYHPPYVEQNLSQAFHLGTPCTKCQKSRNVCSLDFLGLCGIDVDMSRTSRTLSVPLFLYAVQIFLELRLRHL